MTAQKSARFRAGRCCSPYPLHYRAAFAFSAFLYPQRPQPSFRSACRKSGSATGLPCSACVSDRIGPLSSAGGSTSMVAQSSEATPDRTPFWFKPVSTFGLLKITTLIRGSHTLVVTDHPWLLTALVLAVRAWPRGRTRRSLGGYVVSRASHQAVASFACLDRERLMEQPVSSGFTSCKTETQATFRSHKHILGQVDAYCCNLHVGRSCLFKWLVNTSTLAHCDAV